MSVADPIEDPGIVARPESSGVPERPDSRRWLRLRSGPCPPAGNMARDEALLEFVARLGRPVLRLYGWTTPAATFGYFQRYAEVSAMTALRPLIRRPTGGGVVPHDADWTYSLAFPPGDAWYALKAVESYRRVHEWLRATLQRLGIETELAPCCAPEGPGQCFVGAEQFDLLYQGRKIAGAAQRRRRDGLLIQGSLQPARLGLGPVRDAFDQAMVDAATGQWGVAWDEFIPPAGFEARVRELLAVKYGRDDYHQQRVAVQAR